MLDFDGLTIRTRLALTSLVLLVPLAVLVYFMDASFRYDIGIANYEKEGVAYLRAAYPLLELIPEHDRLVVQAANAPPDSEVAMQLTELKHRLDKAFQTLTIAHRRLMRQFGIAAQASPDSTPGTTDPAQLHKLWREQMQMRRPGGAEALLASVVGLMSQAGEKAQLILDPALDSSYLADAIILSLPRSSLLLARLQQDALVNLPRGNEIPPLTGARRDRKIQSAAILEENLRAVMSGATMSLAEDDNFYGKSRSLHQHIPPALKRYRQATRTLLGAMRMLCETGIPAQRYLAALSNARSAAQQLYTAGLDELEKLVQKRLASFRRWRYLAGGSSALAVLFALGIIIFTVRRIDRDMRHVADYAHSVRAGDYNAKPSGVRGGEAQELTATLRSMVGEIKDKIGYLRGILDGMTVPCLVVDRDERLTFINRPYMDLYDRQGDPEDYMGMTLGKLFYDDEGHETITGRCMNSGEPIRGTEFSTTTAAGRTVHVRYDVAPLYDLDNRLIGAFAVIVDLTAIKEQQQEIMWLASFPRESPSPVMSCDESGQLTYMNPATAQCITRLGVDADRGFLPAEHADIVAACLASGQPRHDVESDVADRTFAWNYNPMTTNNQVHVYAADITERKRAEGQLLHDAFHDGLTGLPNRALFLDRLGRELLEQPGPGLGFAVLALDLDHFKTVNDTLGHSVGDELLLAVTQRIRDHFGPAHTLARLSGDEFALVAAPVRGVGGALDIADALLGLFHDPFVVNGYELTSATSVGVVYGDADTVRDADGTDKASQTRIENIAEAILRDADTALYRAKANGRGIAVLFDEGMHHSVRERFELEIAMKRGLENDEFLPFYQPLICMKSGRIAGFEALARWEKPDEGLVSPGRFIPLAEETGQVVELGAQMLRTACTTVRAWTEEFSRNGSGQGMSECGGLTMSVNLSVRQMVLPSIVDDVAAILRDTGVDPRQIKIEVTESGIMENAEAAKDVLVRLKALGVSLSIDDFGTGYSSLSYLTRFPFDFLKVDQSFVRDMHTSTDSLEIVRTIISLAHSLGKQIIAEGIEEQRHYDALRELGCCYGQGYLFARPLPRAEAHALLLSKPVWK